MGFRVSTHMESMRTSGDENGTGIPLSPLWYLKETQERLLSRVGVPGHGESLHADPGQAWMCFLGSFPLFWLPSRVGPSRPPGGAIAAGRGVVTSLPRRVGRCGGGGAGSSGNGPGNSGSSGTGSAGSTASGGSGNSGSASMEYVSPEQLAGFSKYKYSAVDSNPLSLYIMHPFWNAVVKIFPTWLAPNLITFSGFLLLVFNFFLMAYFDPDFYASAPDHQHVPNGVWIVVGLLNFMAYTLDGVDGKQARRTNSSTPLGELFDHGLDSWACVYFVVTVYSTFGRGSTGVSVFVLYLLLWVVLFSFILSHWEKYNTGILFLPWGYDISQVTISIVYIVTAFVGVEAWYAPFLFNFLYRDLFTAMIIGCALTVTLPMSLYNFYKAYKNNALKHHSVYEILLPLVSPVLLFLLCTTWIFLSPTDILEVQPRLFYFMVGTAFANISCQLIVCQMSSTRCQPLNWMLLPIAAVLLLVVSGLAPGSETLLLYLLTAFLTLAHIHYGVVVVSQLSRHFNIRPFSLRKPTPD